MTYILMPEPNARRVRSTRNSIALFLLPLLLCGCGLLQPFANALAAACEQDLLIVNKFDDTNDGLCTEDDCSLREAVITSNNCEGTQTIRIPNGTYYLTIEGQNETESERGDLNLRDAVIIQGLSNPVIDGSGIDRVISINLPHTTDEAKLSNLTIRNGSGGPGAGIFDIRGELFLLDTEVRSNTSSGSGGGIHATSGALDIRRSTIAGNTANGDGGGIFVSTGASLHLYDNSVLEQNRTLEGYSGGGLFNQSGILSVIEDASLQGNTSSGLGGGIYNDGLLSVSRSRIAENRTETLGGGIATTSAGFSMDASQVISNQANSGGGIAIQPGGFDPVTPVIIQSSVFNGNVADHGGGQVFNAAGVDLRLHDSDLISGRSEVGGGIYNLGNLSVVGTSLTGNQADTTGGAVANGGFASFYGTTIDHNRLAEGYGLLNGAAIYASGSLTMLENSTVSGNEIPGGGGFALQLLEAEMHLTNVTVTGTVGSAIFVQHIYPAGVDPASEAHTAYLQSSIFVGNLGGECDSSVVSKGHNLIEMSSPIIPTCVDFGQGDLVLELNDVGSDALLGPLADNGGPTQTHALLPGSPAIDAAGDDCLAEDQRGISRPQGTACDIGAYEVEEETVPLSGELPPIVITRDTLCFAGPGDPYPIVGSLLVGNSALVRGLGANHDWLVIEDPRLAGVNCWVKRIDVEEPQALDPSSLKVFAVPPLPTPTPAPEKAVGCLVQNPNNPKQVICVPRACTPNDQPGGSCTP